MPGLNRCKLADLFVDLPEFDMKLLLEDELIKSTMQNSEKLLPTLATPDAAKAVGQFYTFFAIE